MAAIKNDRDVLLQATSPRILSTSSYISATSTNFTSIKNNGGVTPNTITLTANTTSFTASSIKTWEYALNTEPNTWLPISSGTTASIDIAKATFVANVGNASAITYRLTVTEAPRYTSVSTIAISYTVQADDAIVAVLNTQSEIVLSSYDGATVPAYPTGNMLKLFKGATQLTTGVTYGPASTTTNGLTLTVDTATGALAFGATTSTSWGSANTRETFQVYATYNSVNYYTSYTIVKNKSGYAIFVATVYKQVTPIPGSSPTGGSYNFLNNTLTPPSGWVVTQPTTTTTPTYACTYTFIGAPSTTVTAGTWGTVYMEAVRGADGNNGEYRDVIQLYLTYGVLPTKPTTASYNFSTNTISGVTGTAGWSMTQPGSSTTPTYVTKCTASTTTPGVPVTLTAWSDPIIVAQNGGPGGDGTRGPLFVTTVGLWNQTTVETAIFNMSLGRYPRTPIKGDIASYTGGAKEYDGSSWGSVSTYVDGSIVASGTIAGDRLAATIEISSSGYMKATGKLGNAAVPTYSNVYTTGSFENSTIAANQLIPVGLFGMAKSSASYPAIGVVAAVTQGDLGVGIYTEGTQYGIMAGIAPGGAAATKNAIHASGGTSTIYASNPFATAIETSGRISIFTYAGTAPITATGAGADTVCSTLKVGYATTAGSATTATSATTAGSATSASYLYNSTHSYTFDSGTLTGASTGTFAANKPGTSSTNSWIRLTIDTTVLYIPVWT